MNRIIREARPTDITDIMQLMEVAKKIMRSSGNMHQWGEGYPSEVVITNDMEKHGGYVIENDGHIVGYFAFLPSPEPTYSKIYNGEWLDKGEAIRSGLGSIVIPVAPHRCDHMQFRLSGSHHSRIYSIAKYVQQGSDVHW